MGGGTWKILLALAAAPWTLGAEGLPGGHSAPLPTPAPAHVEPENGESVAAATPEPTAVPKVEEPPFARFSARARKAIEEGRYEEAEACFERALAQDVPRDEKRETLLALATLLDERRKELAPAAVLYEQYLSMFPQDPGAPELYLRLGRIYRDLGSHRAALNRFHEVLSSALRVKTGDASKAVVQSAQIEIADSHLRIGDHEQAGRLYARLKLLNLPPDEAETVAFRAAHVLFLGGDHAGALVAQRDFLQRYPQSRFAPEAQFLLIKSLRTLGRTDEALQETLALLRSGAKRRAENPELWAYWQQKAGNDLANDLYNEGNFVHALTVYQTLAEISGDAEWRWPAVYQIGLCFERLRYPERALEAYRYILDQAAKSAAEASGSGDPAAPPAASLATLRDLAEWRTAHVKWQQEAEASLMPLLRPAAPEPPTRVVLNERVPPPSPAQADAAKPATPPEPPVTGL